MDCSSVASPQRYNVPKVHRWMKSVEKNYCEMIYDDAQDISTSCTADVCCCSAKMLILCIFTVFVLSNCYHAVFRRAPCWVTRLLRMEIQSGQSTAILYNPLSRQPSVIHTVHSTHTLNPDRYGDGDLHVNRLTSSELSTHMFGA